MKRIIIVCCFFLFIGTGLLIGQEGADEWRQINGAEELLGEWEGDIPFKADGMMDTLLLRFRFLFVVTLEDNSFVYDMKMDCESVFDTLVSYLKNHNVDYTKDRLWKEFTESMDDIENIGKTVFIERYYIRMILRGSDSENFDFRAYYINQYANKLRFVSASDSFWPVNGEIILTRNR